MTGVSYATSAEMAGELGPFPGYKKNARAHAARDAQPPPRSPWQDRRLRGLSVNAGAARPRQLPDASWWRMPRGLGQGADAGRKNGYRNAQATVIAPTGTIGLVMDCDTTGIEPDFALVKFKKLAGGGYFKIINRAVPEALKTLGYTDAEIEEIIAYAVGHGTLARRRHQPRPRSRPRASPTAEIEKVENGAASAFDIKFVFNRGRWARTSAPRPEGARPKS
jgi:ribonucleoside-diphosphate reductase alpha chain